MAEIIKMLEKIDLEILVQIIVSYYKKQVDEKIYTYLLFCD